MPWIGQGSKVQPETPVGRISAPESFRATEIGQPGVHAHPRPGGDQKRLRPGDDCGGLTDALARLVGGNMRSISVHR